MSPVSPVSELPGAGQRRGRRPLDARRRRRRGGRARRGRSRRTASGGRAGRRRRRAGTRTGRGARARRRGGRVVVVVVVVDVVVAPGEPPRFPTVVPDPAPPKIDESGFPAINSTAVMNSSATREDDPGRPGERLPGETTRRGGAGAGRCPGLRPSRSPWPARALRRSRNSWRGPRAPPSGSSRDRPRSRTPGRRRRRGRPRRIGRKRLGPGTRRRSPQPAQQRIRLSVGRPYDHLAHGLVPPLDRLRHQRGPDRGRGRPDGHTHDGALDPEDGGDERGQDGAGHRGQDLPYRELHRRRPSRRLIPGDRRDGTGQERPCTRVDDPFVPPPVHDHVRDPVPVPDQTPACDVVGHSPTAPSISSRKRSA